MIRTLTQKTEINYASVTLMEKVHMWEEEHHQAGEGEEHIKLGQHQCPVLFQNDLKKNLKNDLSRFCIEPSGQDSNGELG
jgi:hypothetical protein